MHDAGAAQYNHRHRDELGDRIDPFRKVSFIFVDIFSAFQKTIILVSKLFLFGVFIGKGFHHPDAGQIIFNLGVDVANSLAIGLKGAVPGPRKGTVLIRGAK